MASMNRYIISHDSILFRPQVIVVVGPTSILCTVLDLEFMTSLSFTPSNSEILSAGSSFVKSREKQLLAAHFVSSHVHSQEQQHLIRTPKSGFEGLVSIGIFYNSHFHFHFHFQLLTLHSETEKRRRDSNQGLSCPVPRP